MTRVSKSWVYSMYNEMVRFAGEETTGRKLLKEFVKNLNDLFEANEEVEKMIDENFSIDDYYLQQIKKIVVKDNSFIIYCKSKKPLKFTNYTIIKDELDIKNQVENKFVYPYITELYYENGKFEFHFLMDCNLQKTSAPVDLYDFIIVADSINVEK